jgi:hypothetical protein
MRLPPTTARLVAESVKNSVQCWPHAGVRLAMRPGPLSTNVAGDALQSIPSRRRLWATFVTTWRPHGPREHPGGLGRRASYGPNAQRRELRSPDAPQPRRATAQTRCRGRPHRTARQGLRRAGGACAGRRGPARRPWRTWCHRPGRPRRGCPARPRPVRGLPGRSFQGVLTRWGWWPSRPPRR